MILLVAVSLLIMVLSGQMDLSEPLGCYDGFRSSCIRIDSEGVGQVVTFILLVVSGSLIWHFADERKK